MLPLPLLLHASTLVRVRMQLLQTTAKLLVSTRVLVLVVLFCLSASRSLHSFSGGGRRLAARCLGSGKLLLPGTPPGLTLSTPQALHVPVALLARGQRTHML